MRDGFKKRGVLGFEFAKRGSRYQLGIAQLRLPLSLLYSFGNKISFQGGLKFVQYKDI
jgi:hypothetical protein